MVNTPAEAGFYMPAEWEKHEGTWLQWPHDGTHPGAQMRLEHIWLVMTEALHEHETVHIVVPDERGRDHLPTRWQKASSRSIFLVGRSSASTHSSQPNSAA